MAQVRYQSVRHAVELQLKKVWKDLEDLSVYRQVVLTVHRVRVRINRAFIGRDEHVTFTRKNHLL